MRVLEEYSRLGSGPFGGPAFYSEKVAWARFNLDDVDEQDLWVELFSIVDAELRRLDAEERDQRDG